MKEKKNDADYCGMREMLKDCLSEIQKRSSDNLSLPGISSGFRPLDDLIGGFENGKVYVIGGRPCMGKEELMLSMVIDIVMESELPVLMFSTNDMKSDYVQRLLAIHSQIPTMHLSRGLLQPDEWDRLDETVATLVDAPLFIHNSFDLPLDELTETARNCIRGKGTKIIFIDCLQMIDFANEDENTSERIAKVMCSLKQLACLFNIPIVVGSMLNRGVEHREGLEGKRPQFMDLANSSYIEGLADVIMMVHRPEYYHIYVDERGWEFYGKMEIIVGKNNLKPLGCITLDYHQDTGVVCVGESLIKTICLEEELPF